MPHTVQAISHKNNMPSFFLSVVGKITTLNKFSFFKMLILSPNYFHDYFLLNI